MKSIRKIIREEVIRILKENDEAIYGMYEAMDNIKSEIFQDFLYNNNPDFTKSIGWRVVPYPRLKKIWEGFMKLGFVRDTKGLEMIEKIMIRNALKISVITELAGHKVYGDEGIFGETIGWFVDEQIRCYLQKPPDKNQLNLDFPTEHKPDIQPCGDSSPYAIQFIEDNYNPDNMDVEDIRNMLYDDLHSKFFDYITDPKSGHIYLTDYGMDAIESLAAQLYVEHNSEKKVVLIDKMLNVIHERSDLASWFVQGGSSALSDLSGYEVPDEEAGGYDTKSAISGRYKMSDYR